MPGHWRSSTRTPDCSSSVARRLEQIGRALGVDLAEPDGLLRACLVLTAWRLLGELQPGTTLPCSSTTTVCQ
ncbi:MAG TPA: hypothetical protein VL738_03755 [Dactylosporangium sp.]|nr:hypothetical protein [Dactylosporangium sp.]